MAKITPRTLSGFMELLPAPQQKFERMLEILRKNFALYGFTPIDTPIIESAEILLAKGGGETEKQIYRFQKGDSDLALRFDHTVPLAKYVALHENELCFPFRRYAIGKVYRGERAQRGRFRQFHQFGVECYGATQPVTDAEVISLAWEGMQTLGLKDLTLAINSIGCPTCRAEYHKALRAYFESRREELCETCKERLEKNPMRILDCKSPVCGEIAKGAPRVLDYLCDDCRSHFEKVQTLLKDADIPFTVDAGIVRGLDYYTRTVFEISIPGFPALCGGGRYGGLSKQLGGPDVEGIGFAMGLERLVLLVQAVNPEFNADPVVDIYLVASGADTQSAAMTLAERLRDEVPGVKLMTNHGGGNFKKQFARADKWGARVAVVLGESEVANGTAVVKDLRSGEQTAVAQDSVAAHLRTLLG